MNPAGTDLFPRIGIFVLLCIALSGLAVAGDWAVRMMGL